MYSLHLVGKQTVKITYVSVPNPQCSLWCFLSSL